MRWYDSTVSAAYTLSINTGDLFTNTTAVELTISANPGTADMQVSNDGGFAGIPWEPYTSRKDWTITQFGSYVIPRVVYARFRDVGGTVSGTVQDDVILDITPPTGTVSVTDATGVVVLPRTSSVILHLSATEGTITAIEYCNLHGNWAADAAL